MLCYQSCCWQKAPHPSSVARANVSDVFRYTSCGDGENEKCGLWSLYLWARMERSGKVLLLADNLSVIYCSIFAITIFNHIGRPLLALRVFPFYCQRV